MIKGILFNTDMVRAILDGRKSCTRRIMKKKLVDDALSSPTRLENPDIPDERFIRLLINMPYEKGDILYVRETWADRCNYKACPDSKPKQYYRLCDCCHDISKRDYYYRASDGPQQFTIWKPSIHMPKEAARIWLKVTDVIVERLQDMKPEDAENEGIQVTKDCTGRFGYITDLMFEFGRLWDSIVKKSDIDTYGWDVNPWVWVIEFERCEKPQEVENEI